MRNKFDAQLNALNEEMIRMGNLVSEAISQAIRVFHTQDVTAAREIMKGDEEVDRAQKNIENICFNLLIQQQPVARDLRVITAAMNMVTDMERIGDHAADISEMTILMANSKNKKELEHIGRMASETVLMLHWAIEAYVEKDAKKAQEVIDHDDIVDHLFDDTKSDIVKLITEDPEDGEEALDLLMVAKYFERIGDHATNIGEWVIYSLRTSEEA